MRLRVWGLGLGSSFWSLRFIIGINDYAYWGSSVCGTTILHSGGGGGGDLCIEDIKLYSDVGDVSTWFAVQG